ncbi:hypothetical protein NQD34_008637 [Periophthalmus magnuspinnatus]|nr:hypothetical protein NQD34_008637 [Periophthalmus magnuspinnatus]
MGCRLPKLKKAEERTSPGNIYSTLRRPQVETKVGVAYTYHFLDFLLGKEVCLLAPVEVPVSSVLCLSSVRELPVQVRELYSEGFVLVAVHPFVHACGPDHAHIQRQLHRAVLIRETQSWERRELRWCRHRLETDVCVGGNQAADPELIQSYVKKIQDVAEQGVMFVGFLQQPGPGLSFTGQWDTDELSSLHSSPSPIHRGFSCGASPIEAPGEPQPEVGRVAKDFTRVRTEGSLCGGAVRAESASQQNRSSHNNNHIHLMSQDRERSSSSPRPNSKSRGPQIKVIFKAEGHRPLWSQLFALYNHTEDQDSSLRFYSLRVPLRVHKEAGLVTEVDAHWLDHMTQHFGLQRLCACQGPVFFIFLLCSSDSGVALVDSVFIFQSSTQSVNASYDAIVVEQWTVVDGVMVKADYIPLLQSLAPFGWRLMCVLPTPIVKTNR